MNYKILTSSCEQQNKNCPRIADFPTHHLLKIFRPLTAIVLVTAFKERLLLPSSYRMLPRRKACRAHAPLFEWTNAGCLQPCQRRPYPAHRLQALLPPLPFFSRGGLGVGEKPARGELVRSTHRVPSPFISSQRFPFETFR